MRSTLLIYAFLISLLSTAFAQEKKSYTTAWVQGGVPEIDGVMNEAVWNQVEWGGDFVQFEPNNGETPSQPTQFKILYDAKFLYVGVRALDSVPEKIVRRMARRDNFEGDWVEINIDSYNDKRTAFSFNTAVSGVKGDEYVTNNGENWDQNWDPIWYNKTSIDSLGWTAEMKIPLSQLRFADKESHVWGLQVIRRVLRKEERSTWQHIPQGNAGWVHNFGELNGLKGIRPQKQLEIQPYLLAQTQSFEKEEGNPFATGKLSNWNAGVDGKLGITSDITLDFTINPDFGQVEADPSQVNLGAYQIFFQERRPFFIEGNNILDFPVIPTELGTEFSSDNLFYSRRIGRRPQYYPETIENEYVDQPITSHILGAFKLTGKNKDGLSWGVMESLTSEEKAEIDLYGERRKETVEPITNYLVSRVQKDLNEGKTMFGAMFTSTHRNINDPDLEFLAKDALTGGLDFMHNFKDRKYYVAARLIGSSLRGDPYAILSAQTAPERFFQRPGAPHVQVDSSLQSLNGTGGSILFGKNLGNIIFQSGVNWKSPGLDLNDVGFMQNADDIFHWSWMQYRILKPFSIFRSIRFNFNEWHNWDFSGTMLSQAGNTNIHMNFKNAWRLGSGATLSSRQVSNADLRGGPAMLYPGGKNWWYYVSTNERSKLSFFINSFYYWGNEKYIRNQGYAIRLTYRPINALQLSLQPNLRFLRNDLQYVTTIEEPKRYILGRIDQQTFSSAIRINYNLTPNMSIEYWGQPFISKGKYDQFKYVRNSKADVFEDRFYTLTPSEISWDQSSEIYQVTEGKENIPAYSIENPDFNFAEFRSNLVFRWEYKPGSTLFVVWSQNRSEGLDYNDDNSIGSLADDIFNASVRNIFLIKYTYRFVF